MNIQVILLWGARFVARGCLIATLALAAGWSLGSLLWATDDEASRAPRPQAGKTDAPQPNNVKKDAPDADDDQIGGPDELHDGERRCG